MTEIDRILNFLQAILAYSSPHLGSMIPEERLLSGANCDE